MPKVCPPYMSCGGEPVSTKGSHQITQLLLFSTHFHSHWCEILIKQKPWTAYLEDFQRWHAQTLHHPLCQTSWKNGIRYRHQTLLDSHLYCKIYHETVPETIKLVLHFNCFVFLSDNENVLDQDQ